jgi:hypothetical protein
MTANDCLDPDEMRLGQLLCKKLAGVVKGATSLAMGFCLAGAPHASQFIQESLSRIRSFIVVLRSLGVKPLAECGATGRALRQEALQLSQLTSQFEGPLEVLRDCHGRHFEEVAQAAAGFATAYERFFDVLQTFSETLGSPASFADDKTEGRSIIEQFLIGLEAKRAEAGHVEILKD